ncbi:MAG: SCPU domain-containing protein [Candidatus Tokpelaia sp.]|nr:MAG: SCPU domain-containing protein [Candidatus Tokpelaia sp.]KAA6207403.1 MAG: SCPU domain-containing protein [Candidatus Tokpelaia sp.]
MPVYKIFIVAISFIVSLGVNARADRASPPGQRCTVETTNLVSVTIGNINKAPTITNTLSFSCSLSRAIPADRHMAYCWHIHDSSAGTKPFTYRYATLGSGRNQSRIGFNIYSNGIRVGDRRNEYNIIGYPTKVNDTLYRVDDPITVRFEGNEGVSNLPSGKYIYNNPQTHVTMYMLQPGDALDYRNACGVTNGDVTGTGNAKGNTVVDINIRTYCDIRVGSDMVFPRQFSLKNPVAAQAQVVVNCSAGTDYNVTLDNGQNYSDNMRHMKRSGGDDMIAYSLTPEQWVDTGSSFDQAFSIYGEVPAQATPPVGAYRDAVVVTVDIIK